MMDTGVMVGGDVGMGHVGDDEDDDAGDGGSTGSQLWILHARGGPNSMIHEGVTVAMQMGRRISP